MSSRKNDLARWGRLTLKELRETLRDRRTILTLVLMPVLVYPLLGLVFQKFVFAQYAAAAPPEYQVAFASSAEAENFKTLFQRGDERLEKTGQLQEAQKPGISENGGLPGASLPRPGLQPKPPRLRLVSPDDDEPNTSLDDIIAEQRADIGVRIRQRRSGRWDVQFIVQRGSIVGHNAREFIEARFRAVNDAFVEEVFARQSPPLRLPVTWASKVLPSEAASSAFSLASIVPLILILMTVTGAVYPAIDLTAGERERGTLEALIASPVPRYQLLCAKYAAVLTVVLLTAIANLAAMTATAFSTGLEQALFGREGLSIGLLALLLGLLAVFAMFFSAVILTLTSIARSFKEAQAYLIPLMLVSLAPGVLALFPGLEVNAVWAVTPLANIVLLARELFDHRVTPILAVLTLASTLGYAGVALAVAARVFGTDAVLYGSAATWADLARRPEARRSLPDWTQGVVALAGLFPMYVLLSGVPARFAGWTVLGRLGANAVVLALLFVCWPGAVAWLRRIDWRGAFRVFRPTLLAISGAVCLGISLWPFIYEIVRLVSSERITDLAEQFKALEEEIRRVPLGWKLLTLAVIPAVCEELFFRGFLFQSLKSAVGSAATVGITAALFGLFHIAVGDAVVIERLLPTTIMGLVLGWVSYRTGSMLPGMLLHVLHNTALLTVDRWFPALNPDAAGDNATSVGGPVLAVAGVIAVAGAAMVWRGRPAMPLRRKQ